MLAYAGTAVAIGVPPIPSEVVLQWGGFERAAYPARPACSSRTVGTRSPPGFPKISDRDLDGRLNLDDMATRTLGLDELDEAFRATLAGEVIRSVVRFDA